MAKTAILIQNGAIYAQKVVLTLLHNKMVIFRREVVKIDQNYHYVHLQLVVYQPAQECATN
jgi:hypothetical protein